MSDKSVSCGYAVIVGKPNVGKSTLFNKLLNSKLSITSKKKQTTRACLEATLTADDYSFNLIDTPGLFPISKNLLEKKMNQYSMGWISCADVLLFVTNSHRWTKEDDDALKIIQRAKVPTVVLINKVDLVNDKQQLLPFIEKINQKTNCTDIIPISVTKEQNIDAIIPTVCQYLPKEQKQNILNFEKSVDNRFMISEIIREKIFRFLEHEIANDAVVMLEDIKEEGKIKKIYARIIINNLHQKKLVIGSKGDKIKTIGTMARSDIEKMYNQKVYLNLWVDINKDWTNNEKIINSCRIFTKDYYQTTI